MESNRVRRAKERARIQRKMRITKVIKYCIPLVMLATIIVFLVVRYNNKINIGYKIVNWDKIEYDTGDIDVVEPVGGTVTIESYHKVRMAASAEMIVKLVDLLPEKLFNNLIDGVQSDYYKNIVYEEYVETAKEVRDMLIQAEYINDLYNEHKDLEGFEDFEGCHTEDCSLKKFVDYYTGQELHDRLMDAHKKWESLVEYRVQTMEPDDNTVNMFYQEEIITNLDYIEDIQVKAYILNSKLTKLNDAELIEELRAKGKIPTVSVGIEHTDALKALSLYRSNKFYDENIVGLAAPTITSLFNDGIASNVIDLTDVEDLEQAIKEIEPPKSEDNVRITDMPYISYSLLERSEDDIITIYYDIESIKHIDNIPTLDELRETLEYRAKVYLAEADIASEVDSRLLADYGDLLHTHDEAIEHDHDGDGIADHIYDEATGEWLIYDGHGNYIRETAVDHDHDGDGIPDH